MSKINKKTVDIFIPIKAVTGQNSYTKKKFIEDVNNLVLTKRNRNISLPVRLKATFFFKDKNINDIDNLLKSLFDALQRYGIIVNDKQIKVVSASIEEYSIIEGIRVIINLLDTVTIADSHIPLDAVYMRQIGV